MLKVAVLSSIFIMCVIMGLVKKKDLYFRKKEIEDFIFFIETLKNDIFYRKLPVDIILKEKNLSCLNIFFSKMAESDVQPIFKRYDVVKKEVHRRMSLCNEDWKFLDELFSVLGKTDEVSQYEILDRLLNEIRVYKKEVTAQNEKMGGFYVKMWLAVGALFVIICM